MSHLIISVSLYFVRFSPVTDSSLTLSIPYRIVLSFGMFASTYIISILVLMFDWPNERKKTIGKLVLVPFSMHVHRICWVFIHKKWSDSVVTQFRSRIYTERLAGVLISMEQLFDMRKFKIEKKNRLNFLGLFKIKLSTWNYFNVQMFNTIMQIIIYKHAFTDRIKVILSNLHRCKSQPQFRTARNWIKFRFNYVDAVYDGEKRSTCPNRCSFAFIFIWSMVRMLWPDFSISCHWTFC